MSRILSVRNKHASGLQAALEDLDTGTDDTNTDEVVIVADPETAEVIQDHAELAEAAKDVEEAQDVVEELEEGEAGLEAIAHDLEAAIADGGLEPQAAVYLQHAVDAHTQRLGIRKSIVPSVESFGGKTTRQQATQIALESINEKLVKIWEAIKHACEAVWKAVMAFFERLFVAGPKLKAHAESLRKKVDELKGTPKKKIEVAAEFAKVSINGDFKSPKEVLELMDDVAKFDFAQRPDIRFAVSKEANKDEDAKKGTVKKLVEAAKSEAKARGAFKEDRKESEGEVSYRTDVLPGDSVFVLTYGKPSEGDSVTTAIAKTVEVRISRRKLKDEKKGDEKHEHDPLSKEEMKSFLEDVEAMADRAIKAKAAVKEAMERNEKALEDARKALADNGEVDEAVAAVALRAGGKTLANVARFPYEVYKYGAEVSTAYLSIVSKSIKAYGEDKEGDKEDEKKGEDKKAA